MCTLTSCSTIYLRLSERFRSDILLSPVVEGPFLSSGVRVSVVQEKFWSFWDRWSAEYRVQFLFSHKEMWGKEEERNETYERYSISGFSVL